MSPLDLAPGGDGAPAPFPQDDAGDNARVLRNRLAALLATYAPRGAVRAAEGLAAMALSRRKRALALWGGAFAMAAPSLEACFAALPPQPISARADAAWRAVCRRIAARALAGAGPDPTHGAQFAVPLAAPPPDEAVAPELTARIGPFAFYRDRD